MNRLLALACLILIHPPDGAPLRIDISHIIAVRPVPMGSEEHFARGTKSILYVTGQKFGITETPEQVELLIRDCE
jgi:hypothetical protein